VRTVKIILPLIMGLVLSGCAAPAIESRAGEMFLQGDTTPYVVVAAPTSKVTISQARAYREGEYFVVAGRVKPRNKAQLLGHMDLAVCTADGTILAQEATRISGLAPRRRGAVQRPFRFQLAMAPPEGTKILLQYHAPLSEKVEPSCTGL